VITIDAAQHIYGNVEKEESPHQMGGFQTLSYTKARLTQKESEQLEERLIYFHSEKNPIKWIYFPLSTNKIALSHIVPLMDADRFGRAGSYLGHSIIITAADFEKVAKNPFIIINAMRGQFLEETSAALKKGDKASANIEPLFLKIPEYQLESVTKKTLESSKQWPLSQLKKLAIHGVHFLQDVEKTPPLAISGTDNDIMAVLAVILLCVPYKFKHLYSFDTHFNGCNLVHSHFTAIGYTDPGDAPSHLTLLQALEKKVKSNTVPSDTLYQHWMVNCIDRGELQNIKDHSTLAYELQQLLTSQRYDKTVISNALTTLTETFINDIASTFQKPLTLKVEEKLNATMGSLLSSRLEENRSNYPFHLYRSEPGNMIHILLEGFDMKQLADQIYQQFKPLVAEKPEKQEKKELKALLKKIPHQNLELFLALWITDEKALKVIFNSIPKREAILSEFYSLLEILDFKQVKEIKNIVKDIDGENPSQLLETITQRYTQLHKETFTVKARGVVKNIIAKLPFFKKK
jgi:GTPase-associated protein 1, N-terminal domain type 2